MREVKGHRQLDEVQLVIVLSRRLVRDAIINDRPHQANKLCMPCYCCNLESSCSQDCEYGLN